MESDHDSDHNDFSILSLEPSGKDDDAEESDVVTATESSVTTPAVPQAAYSPESFEAQSSTGQDSNPGSLFSGITNMDDLLETVRVEDGHSNLAAILSDTTGKTDPHGAYQGDQEEISNLSAELMHGDSGNREQDPAAQGGDGEQSGLEAVQRSDEGQVVVNFRSKAPESPATEDKEDVPKSGWISVMDRIHIFEGEKSNEQMISTPSTPSSVSAAGARAHKTPPFSSAGLEDTTSVFTPSTSYPPSRQVTGMTESSEDELQAGQDEESFFSDEGVDPQPKLGSDRGIQSEGIREDKTWATHDRKEKQTHEYQVEEVEKDEMEEKDNSLDDNPDDGCFSTPSSSPAFDQPTSSPHLQRSPQDFWPQGYEQGPPAQHGDRSFNRDSSPAQQGYPKAGQMGNVKDAKTGGTPEYRTTMSPRPLLDTDRSQSMQGLDSAGSSSAFRPVPQRPQRWMSQETLQQGYSGPQYPSPQQQQQHQRQRHPSPLPPQWTSPGSQQMFYQAQQQEASPQPNWPAGSQFPNQQAYQHQLYPQQHMRPHQQWQQQQQPQWQHQQQGHPRRQTPGKGTPSRPPAAPPGVSAHTPLFTPKKADARHRPAFYLESEEQDPTASSSEDFGDGGDSTASSTIRVGGVDNGMDLELLQLYFESPKKSGGDTVSTVADHRSQGFVLLTFENPAVVEQVIQRSHTVSKRKLNVSVFEELTKEPSEDFSCTVQVSGGSIVLDKDMMELYFENPKKSGGGKITNIDVMEDAEITLITFEDQKVAEAVVQRTHTVARTKLTVVPYKPSGPPTKIRVSGLTPKASEELLQFYFEKAGNCDVEDVQLNVDKGEAVVTFADPAAVQTILKQDHCISGKQVAVSVLTSSSSSSEQAETSGPPAPLPTKIRVSGLTSKASEELVELYFEKAAKGSKVVDVQLDVKEGEAVVTFDDPEALQTVLKRDHRVSGRPVTVSLLTSSVSTTKAESSSNPASEVRTLEVRGLGPKTTEETISYYFENKRRSGGGPVEDLQYEAGSGVARITFESAETTKKVLENQHAIDGRTLIVNLYSGSPVPDVASSSELKELPVVSVRGLGPNTSEDTLYNYFENTRRSGGGDVVDVKFDTKRGTVFVTFENPEDAARVVTRPHKIEGRQIEVQLYEPPEMCKDRIVLGNIPEIRTADELLMYVEAKISDLVVDTILFSDEEGTAVVIFDSDIDRPKVQAALTKKAFKGHNLTVDSVPVSSTVLVTALPSNPPVSEDTILNYFENERRSGGGDVTNVELSGNAQYALVTFASTQVAARVARRGHKMQGASVSVNIYMECLGLSGGSEEPTAKIPQRLLISDAHYEKICFLEKLPRLLKETLMTMLNKRHARLDLNDPSGSAFIACTITQETEGFRKLVKSWADDVCGILQDHLQNIFFEQLKVAKEEFAESQDGIEELTRDTPSLGLIYDEERGLLRIVYKGEESRSLVDRVIAKVEEVQSELSRKKKEKTERIEKSRGALLLLQKNSKIQDIQGMYPNLEIDFHDDYLELKGLDQEIQAAKLQLYRTFSNITCLTRRWDSDLHKELLLQNPEAKAFVESDCSQKGPDDVVEFTPNGFSVYSFDEERAEVLQMVVINAVQRRVIKFDDNNRQGTTLREWADLKREILKRNEGMMLVDEDQSSLTLLSVSPSIQKDYNRLQEFLKENSIQQHTFPLPEIMFKLFKSYMEGKTLDMQLKMDDFDFDSDTGQIVVSGNKLVIETAQGIYSSFREMLTEKRTTFTQPSMKEFFRSSEWARKRDEIERDLKCLVLNSDDLPDGFFGWEDAGAVGFSPRFDHQRSVDEEPLPDFAERFEHEKSTDLKMTVSSPGDEQPRRRGLTRPRSQRDSIGVARPADQPKPDLPARPRLYLSVMSDITKEEHHVLVNSSNTGLNMSNGQVSKALLEVGGSEIQQELKTSYPNGIQHGEIAISGGGKLMCKKLIHCCLHEEKDVEKIKTVVRTAVTNCMAEADKAQMGSIGFPSLGTGNLGYPADLVAHTMFTAALDYGRQHPNTIISDVFFILHKKDENLTKVFREEEAVYKQMLRDSQRTEIEEEEPLMPVVNPTSQGIKQFLYFQETRGRVNKVIVGLGSSAIDKAKAELMACYNGRITTLPNDVPQLEQWDDLHIETLKRASQIVDVDITFNFNLGRLELHGLRDNLGKIPLHQTMREAEAAINDMQNAQMVLKQVQWSCIEIAEDGEELVQYNALNNYRIETAYQDGKEKVIVVYDRTAYIIDFARMEERPEDPQDTESTPITVIRQDKIASLDVQPPREWTAMSGQDLDVLPVQQSSTEYTTVSDIFMNSLSMPNAKIVKIERVQNLTLYKQYQALKRQIESTMVNNKRCERTHLWHGTNEEAIQGIIKYGFNRSYSNLQKSAYGQGAYFATSAAYSSRNQYAVASPLTNQRNMFMCNVLVGEYSVGTPDMRTPPEITQGRRYNSTVDNVKQPEIFVTYNDVQAYPEYRIVFTDS